jgi:nitroreductase
LYPTSICDSEGYVITANGKFAPMSSEMLDFLKTRRSAKPALLAVPGPSADELATILTVAARVPDHRMVEPWRFIVFEGDARAKFGEVIAEACKAEDKMEPSETRLETERQRLMRAPTVVVVVSQVKPKPGAPEFEQVLSCGAACMNLCLAANALGYGTSWVTEWISFSPRVTAALGLAENENVAGFIYIGTETETQPDRERPALDKIVSRWQG